MNIALVAPGFLLNRKEATWITLVDLAKEYQIRGHKALIIARKHPLLPPVEKIGDVTIYRYYSGRYGTVLFNAYRSLKRLQQQEKIPIDLVHGFGSSAISALNTYLAGKAIHGPTIHTIKSYPKRMVIHRVFSPSFRLIDRITVPTEIMKKNISCCPDKIKVIHSSINTLKFQPRNRQYLKEKYGFAKKLFILYYGAIRKEKGVDCLLQAMPEVINQFPDAFFFLAIRSRAFAAQQRYWSIVTKLGCEKNCIISLEDLPIEEYVSMADAVVLAYPTIIGTEGNPSCLLEAMASKTPVITTDLPDLREIVTADKDVLMAKPGDSRSLAKEIVRLLKDQLLQKKLVASAFTKSRPFSSKVIADTFLTLYVTALRTGKKS